MLRARARETQNSWEKLHAGRLGAQLNWIKCLNWDLAQIHQTDLLLLLFDFKLSALHSVRNSKFCALIFVLETP